MRPITTARGHAGAHGAQPTPFPIGQSALGSEPRCVARQVASPFCKMMASSRRRFPSSARWRADAATDLFTPYVLPITVGLVALLFTIQRRGRLPGACSVPSCWSGSPPWLCSGCSLIQTPSVLLGQSALCRRVSSPPCRHRLSRVGQCLSGSPRGAEALYATWGISDVSRYNSAGLAVALPALLLWYFGQGALLMRNPAALANPILSPGSGLDALSADCAGDGRNDHRIAGHVIPELFTDIAGGATGYLPPLRITHRPRSSTAKSISPS